MKTYKSQDNTLTIFEYQKGYVSVESGRFKHACQSRKVMLDKFLSGCYLEVDGVSLDISIEEFKEINNFGFGFQIDIEKDEYDTEGISDPNGIFNDHGIY